MISVFYILGIFLLFFSCADRNPDGKSNLLAEIIHIDPYRAETKRFEDVFNNLCFIKLETNDSSLIGSIQRIFVASDKIFISDNQGVFVFDQTGRYISKLKKQGRAPEEYLAFTSLYIDTLNDVFEVLDNRHRKIINYNFEGEFLSERNIPLIPLSFIKKSEDYFFFTGNQYNPDNPYMLIIASIRDQIVSKGEYFPVDLDKSKYLHIFFEYNLYSYEDSIRFFYPFNDTIYSVINYYPRPRYIIDFGDYQLDEGIYERPYADIREFFVELKSKNYAFNMANVHETESFLAFTFHIQNSTRHIFYIKSRKDFIQIKSLEYDFLNRTKRRASLINFPLHVKGENLYGYIESYDLISTMDSIRNNMTPEQWETFSSKNDQIVGIYETSRLDDNPVLMIYNLRNETDEIY